MHEILIEYYSSIILNLILNLKYIKQIDACKIPKKSEFVATLKVRRGHG